MPMYYEETVSIDPNDILDYVRDNKEWFLDRLGEDEHIYKNKMQELSAVIHDLCNDEWDFLRKVRDGTSNLTDKEIVEKCKNIYNQIEAFSEYFSDYVKYKN